jgi:hypothetical protein
MKATKTLKTLLEQKQALAAQIADIDHAIKTISSGIVHGVYKALKKAA